MPVGGIITVCLNPAIDRVIEVENFTIGAHQAGREARLIPAGKAINVSGVLAAMGIPSVATGFLGRENRAIFEGLFRGGLIRDEFLLLPGWTRQNITIADSATGAATHIRDAGLRVEERSVESLAEKLRLLSRPGAVVVFSGSAPPGLGPQRFVELVAGCAAAGAKVAVDASGPALAALAGRKLWLVKPNAAELTELTGRELADLPRQLAAARDLTAAVDVVLFTRGGEGAYLFTPDVALHGRVPVEAHRIRNTVGCGDVLLGAFVGGVHRGLDARRAFRDAVVYASASACTLGTADFQQAAVAEFASRVELAELP